MVGSTAAIFDTGTTQILGDPAGIVKLFKAISGAQAAPQFGQGIYTSTFHSVTNQSTHTYVSSILVPCTFDTPVSVNVGGKAVRISPGSFNLGPVSQGSSTCIAGAAAEEALTGGELVRRLPS